MDGSDGAAEPPAAATMSLKLRVTFGDGYNFKNLWFVGDDGALVSPDDVAAVPSIRVATTTGSGDSDSPALARALERLFQPENKFTLTLSSRSCSSSCAKDDHLHWFVQDIPPPRPNNGGDDHAVGGPQLSLNEGVTVVDYDKFSPALCRSTRKFSVRLWEQRDGPSRSAEDVLHIIHKLWHGNRQGRDAHPEDTTLDVGHTACPHHEDNHLAQYADALGLGRVIGVAGFTVEVEEDDVDSENENAEVASHVSVPPLPESAVPQRQQQARDFRVRGSDDVLTPLSSVSVQSCPTCPLRIA